MGHKGDCEDMVEDEPIVDAMSLVLGDSFTQDSGAASSGSKTNPKGKVKPVRKAAAKAHVAAAPTLTADAAIPPVHRIVARAQANKQQVGKPKILFEVTKASVGFSYIVDLYEK